MKALNRISIAILFIISTIYTSFAQEQIEIVVVGAAHNFGKNPTENFRKTIDQLKGFKPDMVFGEYLSAEDFDALDAKCWAKDAYQERFDYVKKLNPETPKNINQEIKRAYKSLGKFAFYHQTRMDLAKNLALNHDRANSAYQAFILEKYMKDAFGKEEKQHLNQIFGGIDSLKNITGRKSSEYYNIFFPLAYELKQAKIYPMDCQKYDLPWSDAWAKADTLIKIMEKKAESDSTSAEAQILKKMYQVEKDYNKMAAEPIKRGEQMAYFNTEAYGKIDAQGNFYGGEPLYNSVGFPTNEVKEMVKWWIKRNEGMCENVMRQAKANGAKRVVIGVGASHRIWMEDIFRQMPNVKVTNLNDLK
jgi:Family of unknown function (DUF5694)